MPLYDTIGVGYATTRPADLRIIDALCEAIRLPQHSTLLDVGSGTGKYACALAERGFHVIAVEPSAVMRSQGAHHPRVRVIDAAAENIPLAAGAADGAFIMLALHHFSDRQRALAEIFRIIGNGPLVVFSFEPSAFATFWLADYFPTLGREIPSSYSKLRDVGDEVRRLSGRPVRVVPFPLPPDLEDRFAAAGWAKPEIYLDADVRRGISSFSLMSADDVQRGVASLATDLASGAWDRRYAGMRSRSSLDVGYRFIITTEQANKAPEPTTTSVTSPAAQEPRQP